jgi:hypothetical protein
MRYLENMSHMSIEELKAVISDLSEAEKVSLTSWLSLQTMDDWDREMQRDFSPGGRGQHIVAKVKADVVAEKFSPMRESKPSTRK